MNGFASRTISRILRKVSGIGKTGSEDQFLDRVHGVIHVGANAGQERETYSRYGLKVVWIEPIPAVFEVLKSNLAEYPGQVAFQRLLAGQDGIRYTLHVSNNGGASSSILELAAHREIWPEVKFTDAIELEAVTLPTFIREQGLDMDFYDALVLDTQGSELLILKGAIDVLPRFRYVKCEVADFESYAGCCQLPELNSFMSENGFEQTDQTAFAGSARTGQYYNVVYRRR